MMRGKVNLFTDHDRMAQAQVATLQNGSFSALQKPDLQAINSINSFARFASGMILPPPEIKGPSVLHKNHQM